jgi:hypothetical protein
MKSGGERQLHAGHSEDLAPKVAYEHRVAVTDDRVRDPVELDDYVKEGARDGSGGVWMPERDEVSRLRKPIHHSEDHIFAMYLGQSFAKVENNVSPHHGRHLQQLQ